MSFDALAMHAVRDELESCIIGGFVEKIVPMSPLEIGLRLHSQHRDFSLLMSADARSARVHLVSGTLRRLTDDVTPFLLLMRKYVREGRIASIEQPRLERVIQIAVEKRQEDGSTTTSTVIIEVMGRHSNVILIDQDGEVLDALKRVPPSMSRQRPILPHFMYSLPPAVEKQNPLYPDLPDRLIEAADGVDGSTPLWRFLQETVNGMGPLAAREAAFRIAGSTTAGLATVESWQSAAERLRSVFRPIETGEWEPCLVVEEGAVLHFAPYVLTQFPPEQVERVPTISEAIDRFYADDTKLRPAESMRVPLRASLETKLDRVVRKEESLRQALTRGDKAEGLKDAGQAILASTGLMSPGQTELKWNGETIKLDPTLSPSENAQRYFKEYAKARDAAKDVPALLEATVLERQYLEQMQALVEVADGDADLRAISKEIAEGPMRPDRSISQVKSKKGKWAPKKGVKAEQPSGPVKRFTSSDGVPILVGASAKGNERATFDLGTGGDIWLHAHGIPGSHVILKVGGQEPSKQALLEAARLAAYHSQGRGSAKVAVDYTPQRNVKKVKGGPIGLVNYSGEKTVRVAATEPGKDE